MKSLLSSASIFLALFSPLSLAAQKLRVITPMHVEPRISAYAEILDGDIVFDVHPDAQGFEFDLNPGPRGEFTTPTTPGRGYLAPPTDMDPTYAFRFGSSIPANDPDVKYQHFFATHAGCGPMCGGAQLVYDETVQDYAFEGMWLGKPREDGDGFSLRWYNDRETPLGAGYLQVFLIREEIFE